MKKYIILIIALILMMNFSFAEIYNPNLEIQDPTIVSCTTDKVIGRFTVKNNSDIYNSDIFYIVSLEIERPLLAGDNQVKYFKFYEYDPVQLNIGVNETKNIVFEYNFPENLPSAIYRLSIQLHSKTLKIGSFESINIGMLGKEEGFLDRVDIERWKIGKEQIGALKGPNVSIKQPPIAVVELQSDFDEDKVIRPMYTIYERNQTYKDNYLKKTRGEEITLKAGEIIKLELNVPMLDIPESYLIQLVFIDEEGGQISSIYEFRYVLEGASAKILSMNSKYDELNNKVDIDISVIGPADATDLEDAKIAYKIYNSEDKSLVLQKEIKETLTKEAKTIKESIDMNSITGEFDIVVEISSGENTLATMENTISISKLKEQQESFKDLIGTKYIGAVKLLNGLNILNGYPDGTFKPENPITRAEFTVIATKLANLGVQDIQSQELRFNDIAPEHWAKNFIILAYENGIISGYPDGTFKPDNNVTYQEALTILLNVMDYKWEVTKLNLDWPHGYIQMANQLNMMEEVGEVDYTSKANRGDVALLTYKAYLNISNKGN